MDQVGDELTARLTAFLSKDEDLCRTVAWCAENLKDAGKDER